MKKKTLYKYQTFNMEAELKKMSDVRKEHIIDDMYKQMGRVKKNFNEQEVEEKKKKEVRMATDLFRYDFDESLAKRIAKE